MVKEQYNIICLSNQLWDFPIWTNKRHVMMRLAQMGRKVVLSPRSMQDGFLKTDRKGNWSMKDFISNKVDTQVML
jgi:hypothetical protein